MYIGRSKHPGKWCIEGDLDTQVSGVLYEI